MQPCTEVHAPNAVFHASSRDHELLQQELSVHTRIETESAQDTNTQTNAVAPREQVYQEACSVSADRWSAAGWLKENPFGVPTERETSTLARKLPVYRMLLRKRV